MRSIQYFLLFQLNATRIVENSVCECPAGVKGQCKHISAVLHYVNHEPVQSKTEKPCEWTNPSRYAKEKYEKGKPFSELFPKEHSAKIDSKLVDCFSVCETGIECSLKIALKEERKTESERCISSVLNQILDSVFNSCDRRSRENIINDFFWKTIAPLFIIWLQNIN